MCCLHCGQLNLNSDMVSGNDLHLRRGKTGLIFINDIAVAIGDMDTIPIITGFRWDIHRKGTADRTIPRQRNPHADLRPCIIASSIYMRAPEFHPA